MFSSLVSLIRSLYRTNALIPIHKPYFDDKEKEYLCNTIDSTFVSSVGKFVSQFENEISSYTGLSYAIATVNGTSALHTALLLVGVEENTEVLTQSFTFVATCNAVSYCKANPVFIDIEPESLGLCPSSLKAFLEEFGEIRDDGNCWNRSTGFRISACLPMHSFGFPCKINEISAICHQYNIPLVEDAAESLGSFQYDNHTGSFGDCGILSFNGNKIITTGGGGMILTNDQKLSTRAKHITTTAKVRHPWEFVHDEIGFNYRMPNLNASIGLAQLEKLPVFLKSKRSLASEYLNWGQKHGFLFIQESKNSSANYWLNTLVTENRQQRDQFLKETNENGIMTRPAWTPMHQLPIYGNYYKKNLSNTERLFDRLVSLPSSPIL